MVFGTRETNYGLITATLLRFKTIFLFSSFLSKKRINLL